MGDRVQTKQDAATAEPAQAQANKDNAPRSLADVDQMASAGLANTAWTMNFRSVGRGTGSKVSARTPGTSLYVNDLKIAPDGEPGEPNPVPHQFHGVTLAPTGASELGTYAHPKDRGGMVSAAVSFGGRPRFDFTLESPSRADRANIGAVHAEIVRELVASLDDFVDEAEAQANLDRILSAYLEDPASRGTVRRRDPGKTRSVNTSDLRYGPVTGKKTFRLRVDVPSAVKDRSVSYATTSNGEVTSAQESSTGSQVETETTTTASVESQRVTQIEHALSTGIKGAYEKFMSDTNSTESATHHEESKQTEKSKGKKLNGQVKAEIDLVPDIPVIGWLARKLINGKLAIDLQPSFESNTKLTGKWVDAEAGKESATRSSSQKQLSEQEATQVAKHLTSTTLKSQVAVVVKVRGSTSDGQKEIGGSKDARSQAISTTVGSVHVVATTHQPVLVEE